MRETVAALVAMAVLGGAGSAWADDKPCGIFGETDCDNVAPLTIPAGPCGDALPCGETPVADRDGDGVPDAEDACPDVKQGRHPDPRRKGCPEPTDKDRDGDGIKDKKDACPDVSMGTAPDNRPGRLGCPMDSDQDGVIDEHDKCIFEPQGSEPDPKNPGCPLDTDGDGIQDEHDKCPNVPKGSIQDPEHKGCPKDTDSDMVIDEIDQCPEVPQGKVPDPNKPGCPADKDGDGVIDENDKCVDIPQGKVPDPNKPGCPADRDGDTVIDDADACPDVPGAPDPNPNKNGCPGLVLIKSGKIEILQPVFFTTNKDVILPKSFPVLNAVANAIKSLPARKDVSVEGHTDSQGRAEYNLDLSNRRAKSVKLWLAKEGRIEEVRLRAVGFGLTRPIADNKTAKGREANRRVEFLIIDRQPAPPANSVE